MTDGSTVKYFVAIGLQKGLKILQQVTLNLNDQASEKSLQLSINDVMGSMAIEKWSYLHIFCDDNIKA